MCPEKELRQKQEEVKEGFISSRMAEYRSIEKFNLS